MERISKMREIRIKALDNIEEVYDLNRGDVIIAKVGRDKPTYAVCVERPEERITLLAVDSRDSLFSYTFDPRDIEVQVGSLGGLKKMNPSEKRTYDFSDIDYREMKSLAEEAGLIGGER